MAEPLTRVDSAVDGLSSSPPKVKTENRVDSGIADVEESPIKEKAEVPEKTSAAARRKSSMVPGVNSIKELSKFILQVLGSPATISDSKLISILYRGEQDLHSSSEGNTRDRMVSHH